MFSLALVAAISAPLPTASPPKEIIRTKTSPFCSDLRETVAPLVLGVILDDKLVLRSAYALGKLGKDTTLDAHGASAKFDGIYLSRLVDALVHNLKIMDDALADSKRFPGGTTGADSVRLDGLQMGLHRIVASQKRQLNIINGTVATADFDAINESGSEEQALITQPSLRGFVRPPGSASFSIDRIGFGAGPAPIPGEPPDPSALIEHFTVGSNLYEAQIGSIIAEQKSNNENESTLSSAIIMAAEKCK